MRYEILLPPLPPGFCPGKDFKVCHLSERPAFLRIEGGRLSEEGFLKELRVEGGVSLYKGTWGSILMMIDLVKAGRIQVISLPSPTKSKGRPITEKQRRFLLSLMEELGERHPIPASRRDASLLINYLLDKRRKRKKEVRHGKVVKS